MVRVVLSTVVLCLAVLCGEASAQFATDARTLGMAGVHLRRGQGLDRYNPAYRAVPDQPTDLIKSPKFTMPIPLGLIPFLEEHPIDSWGDDPMFDPSSPSFNPIELLDLVLHPPIFLEIKEITLPVNNVEFTIGKNELIADLGATQGLVPADQFGVATTARLIDVGFNRVGVRAGVMTWMRYEVAGELGDTLLAFLKEAMPAQTNTRYNLLAGIQAQTGFSPYVGWSGRVAGEDTRGLFVGGTVRYLFGVAYGRSDVDAGFTTSDTIFSTSSGLAADITANSAYSSWGNSLGTGIGADVGIVLVNGPLELGLGVADIGATITWKDTRVEQTVYNTTTDEFQTTLLGRGVETKTELPLAYLANLTYTTGDVTMGANLQNTGHRTSLSIGAETMFGPIAVRGGVTRDQRKRLQFGWGAGVRFGALELDVGFFTHGSSLSDERGITMATSFSVY